MRIIRHCLLAVGLILASTFGSLSERASAATAAELSADGRAALGRLYAQSSKASRVGRSAKAILVFPKIVKAGLVVGGQGGEGVLFVRGKPTAYYKIGAASFGLQAGGQSFSYALFLMTDKAVAHLEKSNGWSIGSGPSVVVIDQGKAKTMNTTTLKDDVYAFPFGQKGLMAGLGLEGSKISRIKR
jgi:lipid-binding SYLF domain-containing protein